MQEWKRKDIRKSVLNFEKTGDWENLMDIPRILSKTKSPALTGLIETTYKILFLFNYIKRKGV